MSSGTPGILVRERLAHDGDIDAIARLHAASFATPWPADDWRAYLTSSDAHDGTDRLYVTRRINHDGSDGPLAGFILARRIADEAEILAIAVDPASRRYGLARRLIDRLMADLRQLLPCRLFLEVSVENTAALALYAASGFAEVGTRRQYYAIPGRPPVDAKILACDLGR